MRLSKKQYLIFKKIAETQRISNNELAAQFNASSTTISKNLLPLKKINLIRNEAKKICLVNNKFAIVLAQFLFDHPGSEVLLYGEGLELILQLKTAKIIDELAQNLAISKISIYRRLSVFRKRGMLVKEKSRYSLNGKIWPDLKLLAEEAEFQQIRLDKSLPINSKIYYYSKERIVFSTNLLVEAHLTSFSKYSDYGMSIFEEETFYRLPIKKLDTADIFLDSLDCMTNNRRKVLCIVFFLKHKNKLRKLKHPQLENIKNLLTGKKIEGYPALEEIKEKVEIYDIKI